MRFDREVVKKTFAEYTVPYHVFGEKVRLKNEHTYRVADLCERIAVSEHLTKEDVDIAWLCGMLHDVGRFEQVKRYNTFKDADSMDHALLGTQILFDDGKINDYMTEVSETEKVFLKNIIGCHSAYRIPETFDDKTKMFANILRDADKIDILKVNIDFPLEEIYNVTTDELRNGEIAQEVLDSFAQEQATKRSLVKSPVDQVAGHISLVFELIYKESIAIVLEQGYLEKLMNFETNNPHTREQFAQLRVMMDTYLKKQGF